MDRQTVIAEEIRQPQDIGSIEVGRHIGVAINKTALRARYVMRQSVCETLGKSVTGPDSLYASREVPDSTVNAFAATQTDVNGASASVYVDAQQGKARQGKMGVGRWLSGS